MLCHLHVSPTCIFNERTTYYTHASTRWILYTLGIGQHHGDLLKDHFHKWDLRFIDYLVVQKFGTLNLGCHIIAIARKERITLLTSQDIGLPHNT